MPIWGCSRKKSWWITRGLVGGESDRQAEDLAPFFDNPISLALKIGIQAIDQGTSEHLEFEHVQASASLTGFQSTWMQLD
jgi:hypothetical protein